MESDIRTDAPVTAEVLGAADGTSRAGRAGMDDEASLTGRRGSEAVANDFNGAASDGVSSWFKEAEESRRAVRTVVTYDDNGQKIQVGTESLSGWYGEDSVYAASTGDFSEAATMVVSLSAPTMVTSMTTRVRAKITDAMSEERLDRKKSSEKKSVLSHDALLAALAEEEPEGADQRAPSTPSFPLEGPAAFTQVPELTPEAARTEEAIPDPAVQQVAPDPWQFAARFIAHMSMGACCSKT